MRPTLRSAYMELVTTFPLTAIENDEELEAAIEFAKNLAAKKLQVHTLVDSKRRTAFFQNGDRGTGDVF